MGIKHERILRIIGKLPQDARPTLEPDIPRQSTFDLARCRPGSELKNILRDWLGIDAAAGCGCNSMAARMDRLGPDWCEGPGMPEILGVMRAEHAKRRAAGTTILPWSDTAARQLVLLACRRARASA